MIHDVLLILWDCTKATDEGKTCYSNKGDEEIYGRLCEIAKSHHRIQNFVVSAAFPSRNIIGFRTYGLYAQALSEGISEVLKTYKETLVEVQSLIIGNPNYTMSFVYSYVEKYRGLFDTLNKIITTIEDRRLVGCQILSLINQHLLCGDEMVHKAIIKIFTCLYKVFVNQMCMWMLYGDLKDRYQEFFIRHSQNEQSSESFFLAPFTNSPADKSLAYTLQETSLHCGYALNTNRIPHFIPLSLMQEVLFIGKTVILFGIVPKKGKRDRSSTRTILPFQKYKADSKRFTIWKDKEAEFHQKLQKLTEPELFGVSDLRNVVKEIKECVTKHLWNVAVEEAQLFQELRLMKDFYLLGRGELFLELLRLTAHILDKPPTRTGTRDMNHAFQLAARAVFLSNNPDIEKFSFELPYVKPNISTNSSIEEDSCIGPDGWTSIILKYDFKWPLHLLFTSEVLARYNDMFRLLLRIKKTQHDLHALWKTYKQSSSFPMCQLHNKLMFLMDNLQHYMQADVLETNFSRLMEELNKTNDFAKLKKAHATFLADVLSQSFLTITSTNESECSSDTGDSINNPVFCNIMDLLQLCDSFVDVKELATDKTSQQYYIRGFTERFNILVAKLLQLLVSLRTRGCGAHLVRLLTRLDYNRWLSGEAQLTRSVTNIF